MTPRPGGRRPARPSRPRSAVPPPMTTPGGSRRPPAPTWTARPWVHPAERAAEGKAARKRVPRASHAAFEPAPGRDPIAILAAQEADRLPELVPLRHERMAESAFAYYRGTPAVMAFDLAATPAHRHHRPGQRRRPPLELRALRLAGADPRLRRQRLRRDAARALGVGRQAARRERRHRRPRQRLQRRARTARRRWPPSAATASGWPATPGMRLIDVWYASITDADIREAAEATRAARGPGRSRPPPAARGDLQQGPPARRHARLRVAHRGRRRPPGHPRRPAGHHARRRPRRQRTALEKVFTDYRATMPENRRDFLERYRFVDFALKVVGVGSVGTRCYVVVLAGPRRERPAHPPGQGGDRLRPGAVPRRPARTPTTPSASSSASSSCRPPPTSSWAGPGTRQARLLPPPAVGHEGLRRHHDPPAAGPGLLRRPVRLGAGAGPRPHRRRGGDRRLPRRRATRSTARIADFAETYADVNAARPRGVPGGDRGGPGIDPDARLTKQGGAARPMGHHHDEAEDEQIPFSLEGAAGSGHHIVVTAAKRQLARRAPGTAVASTPDDRGVRPVRGRLRARGDPVPGGARPRPRSQRPRRPAPPRPEDGDAGAPGRRPDQRRGPDGPLPRASGATTPSRRPSRSGTCSSAPPSAGEPR